MHRVPCVIRRAGTAWWSIAVGASVLSLLLAAPVASSAAVRESYQVREGGQLRELVVALDEVYVWPAGQLGQAVAVPLLANAEAIRLHAELLDTTTGNNVELVLYEAGQPKNNYSRRILTKQVLVKLTPEGDAGAISVAVNAVTRGEVSYAPGYYLFESEGTGGALPLTDRLRLQPGVESADPMFARQMSKRLIPNDPLFTNQWHLLHTGQQGGTAGMDIRVTNVWNTLRGSGVTISIVDDGLQGSHPDLTNNVNFALGLDINGGDNDPSPNVAGDFHGTAVAGVAAARGNNGIGVAGVAYEASLVGIRLIAGPFTDAQEAQAMLHSNDVVFVSNNSWGPADDGRNLTAPGPLMAGAFAQGALAGRGGRGTIFVWAGGNGAQSFDNSNYDGYANSIYTIAVGALNDLGNRAAYSEPGANVVISAPAGNDGLRPQGTSTTDLVGNNGYNTSTTVGNYADRDYTDDFNGTSSAAPVVAGGIALLLQANPNLGWRDVQEILMRSATKNAPNDPDWVTNSAGFAFNHQFGAGLLNVQSAVALASNWVNLGVQTTFAVGQSNLALPIPDNTPVGVTNTFTVTNANFRLEHVRLKVNATHTFRGDLAITLISPSGIRSRLSELHNDFNDNYTDWTFMTVRNWGELADGTWTVTVSDLFAAEVGILNSLQIDFHGTISNALSSVSAPVITTQPRGRTATERSTVVLSVEATGSAPLFYQWAKNGVPMIGSVTPVLTLPNVRTNDAAVYTVVISNPQATVTSANAVLFVNSPPKIEVHPQGQLAILGSQVSLSVASTGTAPFSYQWRRNGIPVAGATTGTLTLTNVLLTTSGSYDVLVANSLASVFSSNAVLNITPPFAISTPPTNQSLQVGASATLVAGVTGTGPFTYQWTLEGAALPDQTNTSLTLGNLQLTNSGNYAITVNTPLGALTSPNAQLTVFTPFNISTNSFQLGGFFQIVVAGDNGRSFRLEGSTDLKVWTPIATNSISGGTASFTDGAAGSQVRRFYRIVLIP